MTFTVVFDIVNVVFGLWRIYVCELSVGVLHRAYLSGSSDKGLDIGKKL